MRCLMLGAGHSPLVRRFKTKDSCPDAEVEWITLDVNPSGEPDVVFDLDEIEKGEHLPFPSNHFDELHAYEVLEHYGRQGDYRRFFRGMGELWRILKPEGVLIGTCPAWNGIWAWGDPGHTRVILPETFTYLEKKAYTGLGDTTRSDYRCYVEPHWWKLVHSDLGADHLVFGLVKDVEGA